MFLENKPSTLTLEAFDFMHEPVALMFGHFYLLLIVYGNWTEGVFVRTNLISHGSGDVKTT